MRAVTRLRLAAVAVAVCAAVGIWTVAAGARTPASHAHESTTVQRFGLGGYVLNAKYTKGRNTGNTFQQTYTDGTVQGVPIAGPYVGTQFPVEDYVSMYIGHHEMYVCWLDTSTNAILDVFVMNFKTHKIWDYAPGSLTPESTGIVTVVKAGHHPIP
jgi:hypothetical protein